METKNILIGLGVAGAIGAYLYFNNKKNRPRPRPRNNGGTTEDTTDTTDTEDTTDTTDTGTDTGNTSGGTSGGGISGGNTTDGLTEEQILMLSCNSVGGTWINSTCVYTNSPNPRGTEVAQTDFDIDIFGGHSGSSTSTSGSLGAINTNPKTGYSTNTGGTSGGSTPNYSVEFCGLKM